MDGWEDGTVKYVRAYLCTTSAFFLGSCAHLCITLMPIPLAEAGYSERNRHSAHIKLTTLACATIVYTIVTCQIYRDIQGYTSINRDIWRLQ